MDEHVTQEPEPVEEPPSVWPSLLPWLGAVLLFGGGNVALAMPGGPEAACGWVLALVGCGIIFTRRIHHSLADPLAMLALVAGVVLSGWSSPVVRHQGLLLLLSAVPLLGARCGWGTGRL